MHVLFYFYCVCNLYYITSICLNFICAPKTDTNAIKVRSLYDDKQRKKRSFVKVLTLSLRFKTLSGTATIIAYCLPSGARLVHPVT